MMRRARTSLRAAVLLLLLMALLASIAAVSLFAVAEQSYTIVDGETVLPIAGNYKSVDTLLEAADIRVRPEDAVSPLSTQQSSEPIEVKIERARPVTVRTRNETHTLWTLQKSLGAFLREAGYGLTADEPIFADGVLVPVSALGSTELPENVEIGQFLTVTIQDRARRQLLRTGATTVAGALEEAGILLDSTDGVDPELTEPLSQDMVIRVVRSVPFTIEVDGQLLQTRSSHTDVPSVLAEAGVILSDYDYTVPGNDATLRPNDGIKVVRVTEDFRTEDEAIPFQTLWQATSTLPIDSQELISNGLPGILRRRIRVGYEDGIEVSRELDGEWVAREPVNEVMGYGTNIVLGVVDTPEGPREYWRIVRMRATSYTAASSGKDPGDPGYGRTASGVPAGFGVVAVDRNIVPFLTYVYVPGYGVAFVGDTGGGIRGRWIDLGYDVDNFVSWSGYVDVYYLTPVPPPGDINYLLPAVPP